MGTPTPNKGYSAPTVNADNNLWGTEIVNNYTIQDTNMGGVGTLSVAGNSNVTASTAQAQNLVQNLTGALTGNIKYLLPAVGSFYIIYNGTTGAYSLTVATVVGGSVGVVVPQGVSSHVWSDGTNVYAVYPPPASIYVLGEARSIAFPEALLPAGWYVCYGQTRPRTDPLWLATGAVNAAYWVWGNGDGSTTYTLPDFRGRTLFGKDNMGGSAANRLTAAVSGVTGTTLGAVGGDQHAQADTIIITDAGHYHGLPNGGAWAGSGGDNPSVVAGGTFGNIITSTQPAATGITAASGLTGASQNVPPAAVVNIMIYCGA